MPADSPAPDPVAAWLAEARVQLETGSLRQFAAGHAPRLLAAVERVRALTGDWDSHAREMREEAVASGLHPALAGAHRDANLLAKCAADLHEAISAALLGKGDDDA